MQETHATILKMLHKKLVLNPIVLNDAQYEQYAIYLEQLAQWQKVFNLSAITHLEDQIASHLMDSLSIAPFLKGERFIDVGTGAGLPGLILAIACPDKNFTLLDSVQKKTHFLQHMKALLNLKNVEVVHARAEAFKPHALFDGILTRAVSDLATLLKITAHLCAPEGLFYAMKGQYPADELKDLPENIETVDIPELTVPGLEAQRHLVILRKKK